MASLASPVTFADEAQTIPSGDGKVLSVDGTEALVLRGSDEWKNETVSCSILPLAADTSVQGIFACANGGFNFTKYDAYFAVTFLRYQGASMIRLWLNGGDVFTDFPGNTGASVIPPANALDGKYHKMTIVVNRDGTHPLLTALWDDVEVATFGPDQWWSDRVPKGKAGLFTWYRAPGDKTLWDNFQASTTDTVPVELSSFNAE